MAIFGYLGEFRGSDRLDALREYARGLAEATAGTSESSAQLGPDRQSACWGPVVATEGALSLALTGAPQLHSTPLIPAEGVSGVARAILTGYRLRGKGILGELTGPFSLALIDRDTGRAVLAVDRMGIEGLAYHAGGGSLVFATSAGAVARSSALGARLHPQGLLDYLFHHIVPAPDTVFQGVQKLRAGCCATFENGAIRVERYWVPHFRSEDDTSFGRLKAQLHEALHGAVERSVPSAAAVGAFLSGGLDSSTVAGMLSVVGGVPAQTFSIGFGYPDYDELAYARIVNAHFGCQGHEYVVRGSDIVDAFALIARAYDEPFGNASALPTYYCARLARQHGVTRLLAGDGGDELFAGNSRYVDQQIFERYGRVPPWVRRYLLEPMLLGPLAPTGLPVIRKAANYIRQASTRLPDRLERWNLLLRLGFSEVLCSDFLRATQPESVFERMREVWDSTPSDDYLQRMLYYDWQYTLADNDLRKVGTMCSLAGVEVAYPMLDPAVVDFSTCVPPAIMMPRGKLRHFYKRAMGDFLPEAVITKKKHGFGLPFGLWLAESAALRELIFDNLSSLRKRGIVRPEFLDRLLRLHGEEDSRYYGVFVWVAAMLEQWMQEHRVSL